MFQRLLILLVLVAISWLSAVFKMPILTHITHILVLGLIAFLILQVRKKIASREKERMMEKIEDLERKIESMVKK